MTNTTPTARPILEPVTITLGPDAAADGRIRITVRTADTVVYTRSTKFDAGMIGRIERYLKDADIYRQTAYSNDGDTMIATGQWATVAA